MTSSQAAVMHPTEAPQSAEAVANMTVRKRMKAELEDLMDSGAVVLDGKRTNRGKRTSKPLIEEILEEDEEIRAEFLEDVDIQDLESDDSDTEGSDVSDSEVEDEVSLEDEDNVEDKDGVEGEDVAVETEEHDVGNEKESTKKKDKS